jgi:hypothetical protein
VNWIGERRFQKKKSEKTKNDGRNFLVKKKLAFPNLNFDVPPSSRITLAYTTVPTSRNLSLRSCHEVRHARLPTKQRLPVFGERGEEKGLRERRRGRERKNGAFVSNESAVDSKLSPGGGGGGGLLSLRPIFSLFCAPHHRARAAPGSPPIDPHASTESPRGHAPCATAKGKERHAVVLAEEREREKAKQMKREACFFLFAFDDNLAHANQSIEVSPSTCSSPMTTTVSVAPSPPSRGTAGTSATTVSSIAAIAGVASWARGGRREELDKKKKGKELMLERNEGVLAPAEKKTRGKNSKKKKKKKKLSPTTLGTPSVVKALSLSNTRKAPFFHSLASSSSSPSHLRERDSTRETPQRQQPLSTFLLSTCFFFRSSENDALFFFFFFRSPVPQQQRCQQQHEDAVALPLAPRQGPSGER